MGIAIAADIVVIARRGTPAQASVTALLGFLFVNGFVLGAQGTLSWSGEDDVLLLGAFLVLAVVVSVVHPQATVKLKGTHEGGISHG